MSPALERLHAALTAGSMTISVAESCTGGLLAAALTERPGSSRFFAGGVVTYSNAAKVRLLDVAESTLAAHGAVSSEVARAMVLGVRALFGTDVGLSVTGVAGPDQDGVKPVGLTYIGAAAGDTVTVRECRWAGNRAANRAASVDAAIALALEVMSSQHDSPV